MKYYPSTTEFNCGIDLHAHRMYACLMDRQGNKLVHYNIKDNDSDYFLKLVKPYRHDLTVCAECMFGCTVAVRQDPASIHEEEQSPPGAAKLPSERTKDFGAAAPGPSPSKNWKPRLASGQPPFALIG